MLSASGQHPAHECSEREILNKFKEPMPFVPSMLSADSEWIERRTKIFEQSVEWLLLAAGKTPRPGAKGLPVKSFVLSMHAKN